MSYNLPVLECKRCGHKWIPRSERKPTICPKCKSPYYDKERVRGGGEKQIATKEEKLTDYKQGYLEAIIDGEGTLTVRKLKNKRYKAGYEFAPMLYISNTDKALLEHIKNLMNGKGSIVVHQKYNEDTNYKPSLKYQFTRADMRSILLQLNLVSKKRQKELVLEALELCSKNRWESPMTKNKIDQLMKIVEKIRSLNNRGLNAEGNRERMREKREEK